jgi:integrase/recombinase XerD
VVNYLADLRAFLRWSEKTKGNSHSPFALDTPDLRAYCSYLEQVKSHTPATINRRIQTLRKFYDMAYGQGWIGSNPAETVPLLREVASERSRSLTAHDVRQLLGAVRGCRTTWAHRDWVIIQMLLGAGLKLGELTELQLDDVNLESGEPCLLIRGTPANPGRRVPLDPEVYEAVRSYLPVRKAAPGVEHLCVNRDGRPLSTRSVQRLLHAYARTAGLEGLTTQALRYVYARKAYESCGDLGAVANLLGHRHLATTIRYLRPSSPPME